MPLTSTTDIIGYYEDLLLERVPHDETWQDIGALLMPHVSEIQAKTIPGTRQTGQIYDSTGIDALDKLVSAIMGTMFSPVVPWFTLTPRSPELKTDPETLAWMETVSLDIFDTINSSNFDRATPGMIMENAAVGTGALGVIEAPASLAPGTSGFRGLNHYGVPMGTYVIDEDAWGNVDTLIRTYWMSARAFLREFPDAELDQTQRTMLEQHPHRRVQLVHSVIPNGSTGALKWDSRTILVGLDSFQIPSHVGPARVDVAQEGFRTFPYIVPRWFQVPGDPWGRGRGHIVFPEVRTANRARQLKLRAWAKTIDPPLQVLHRGVFGKVRLIPGAENVVRQQGAIEAMDFKIRFDHNAIPETESKMQIRQMFFTEQLLQFATDRKTPPTATEVLQRMDFLHQLLGPASGRLRVEGQIPYIKRVFELKQRARAFPPPPDQLLLSGGVVDIEFLGPLARAQHNDELRGISETLGIVGGLGEMDPDVIDNYDMDQIARDLPRVTGVPRRYLRSTTRVKARRDARAEQQAQMAQQEGAVQQGQAAKDFAAADQADAQAAAIQRGTP